MFVVVVVVVELQYFFLFLWQIVEACDGARLPKTETFYDTECGWGGRLDVCITKAYNDDVKPLI